MYRATTPTHIFWFNEIDPLTTYKSILITYAQNDKILLEKTKQDLTFGSEMKCDSICYYASIKLTQEETKLFSAKPNNTVIIQIRAITPDGIASASTKIKIPCLDVLDDTDLITEDSGGGDEPTYPEYKGSYVVMPSFDATLLETQGKLLTSNVRVLPIQILRVDNLAGGTTVYVGGPLNG